MIHWQPADPRPALQPADIHVWRLSPVAHPAAATWLDDAERARLDAMTDPAGRARLLATRGGLRRVLAGYLDCEPGEVALRIDAGGKPRAADGPEFNLSHSGELALLAVASHPVGVDVERLRTVPRALAIARRVLDAATVAAMEALPPDARDDAFLTAWTAMEARQKCLGQGVFGVPIPAERVGGLAFAPDAGHLGHLAWEDPDLTPRVRWIIASS